MNDRETVEAVVREEWCQLLSLPAAKEDENFFQLGGDSLMAVELVERLEQRLGIAIPLESLFVDGTLGAVIAACLSSDQAASA